MRLWINGSLNWNVIVSAGAGVDQETWGIPRLVCPSGIRYWFSLLTQHGIWMLSAVRYLSYTKHFKNFPIIMNGKFPCGLECPSYWQHNLFHKCLHILGLYVITWCTISIRNLNTLYQGIHVACWIFFRWKIKLSIRDIRFMCMCLYVVCRWDQLIPRWDWDTAGSEQQNQTERDLCLLRKRR